MRYGLCTHRNVSHRSNSYVLVTSTCDLEPETSLVAARNFRVTNYNKAPKTSVIGYVWELVGKKSSLSKVSCFSTTVRLPVPLMRASQKSQSCFAPAIRGRLMWIHPATPD